jgi:hypothetical protein
MTSRDFLRETSGLRGIDPGRNTEMIGLGIADIRNVGMPSISRFLGITIWMYHNDHAPPHVHARYAGEEAVIDIESLAVLDGWLPPRVLGLVFEWSIRYREELRANWGLARDDKPLRPVPPLE